MICLGGTAQGLDLSQKQALKLVGLYDAYVIADSTIHAQQATITKQQIEIDTLAYSNDRQAELIIGLNLTIGNLKETNEKQQEVSNHYGDLYKSERRKKVMWGIGGTVIGAGLGIIIGSIIAN